MTPPLEVSNWIARQLFEYVPSNIVVIDRNFNVVLANDNFKEVFGDPTGKRCYQAYKKRNNVCDHCMAAQTFQDGKVRVNDEEGFDRKGSLAHYIVHLAPVYNEVGEISHIIEMSYDVTETKTLQKEYNILFERVPCYVAIINRDFRIVRANELMRERFGENRGKPCYELLKHRSERCTDCPAMRTFSNGKTYRSEHKGIDKEGSPTDYIVSTAPLSRSGNEFSHVIEMSVDITDIRKLSRKLERESSFRRLLTQNSPDALIAFDSNGVVTIFNPAAESLLGLKSEEVIGNCRADNFLPCEFFQAIDEGKTSLTQQTTIKNTKDQDIPVRFYGTVLRNEEKVVGGAAYMQDLRELKQLELEKLDNERLAAVGQTVAQLAHGIKNILTGLQGGMYEIGAGIKKNSMERTAKGWSILDRNVQRITMLVKEFLNFAKKHVPNIEPIDLRVLAEEVYELYKDVAKQKNIDFQLEIKNDIAPCNMDAQDIHTCLANLVSNAIDACRFSEKKEGTIVLRLEEVDASVIIEVSDTGCGMEEDLKKKIFTTFFTTKGLAGSGLGLLVTNKMVKEHGGRIKVDSEEGIGSVFRLEFPRKRLPLPV